MKKIKSKLILWGLAGLIAICSGTSCYAAIPLPTVDWKRLSQSAKTVSSQASLVQKEIQENLYIIQQIQNGGYAAAAGALFGKIENGDYDRYGKIWADSKDAINDGAQAAGMNAQEKSKKKKENKKKAQKEGEEIAKQDAEAKDAADKTHEKNTNTLKSLYNWTKKHGRSASSAVFGTISAVEDGGGLVKVGSGIYNAGKGLGKELSDEHKAKKEAEENAKKKTDQTQAQTQTDTGAAQTELEKAKAEAEQARKELEKAKAEAEQSKKELQQLKDELEQLKKQLNNKSGTTN